MYKVLCYLIAFISITNLKPVLLDSESDHTKLDYTSQNNCAPYIEETQEFLSDFINNIGNENILEEVGLSDDISIDDIETFDNNSDACIKLYQILPWPMDKFNINYYKVKNRYVIVQIPKPLPKPKGNTLSLETGYSLLIFLDENFDQKGAYLL